MNACWSRVPGVVACCLVDELADDPEGEAAGGVVEGRDRLAGAGLGLAAASPRSWPVARTPGTAPLADSPVPAFPAPGPAPGMPPVPASATPPSRPGTVTVALAAGFAFAFAGAALALAGAVLPDAGWRSPLSTNPAMPCSASGAAEEWALRVKPGSESAPMVSRTPPEWLTTT